MTEHPNIVVVISDSLRRDHIGAYGNSWIYTPTIDQLALEGVVFDQHIIGSFPTVPMRADLLTGRLSCSFMGWEPIPTHLTVLPRYLASAGYRTMAVVDVPFYARDNFGLDRGFEDFIWIRGQGNHARMMEREDVRADWVKESDRMAAQTITAAEGWLEKHYKDRFFLLVDTWDPHEPYDPPRYYTELYLPEYDGRQVYPPYNKWREVGMTEEELKIGHATYCGEVTMVDRWLGSLLSKLKVLGIEDNTVLVFTSDHGCYFGEHGYFGKAVFLRERRGRQVHGDDVPAWLQHSSMSIMGWSPLYREVTNAPLIIRGPEFQPGRRSALTTATDLTATILDLAKVEQTDDYHGRSLLPVLRGERIDHRDLVISSWPLYFAEGETTSAVDNEPRKIRSCQPLTITTKEWSVIIGGPDDTVEMYDVVSDPAEESNLWETHKEVGLDLVRRAVTHLADIGTPEKHLLPRRRAIEKASARSSGR